MGQLEIFYAGISAEDLPKGASALFNVFSVGNNDIEIEETKKALRERGVRYVILDSGGYQLWGAEKGDKQITNNPNEPLADRSKFINIAPEYVIEKAKAFDPSILMALDFPVYKSSRTMYRNPDMLFLDKPGYNAGWAMQMSKLKEKHCSTNTSFFIPVQCFTLRQFNCFHYIIKYFQFDGFSFPSVKKKFKKIAPFLAKFYQIGIKNIHLLGTTSLHNLALAAYMAKHYFDWVSLDATSWRFQADHYEYMSPYNLSDVKDSRDAIIDKEVSYQEVCSCPYCEGKTLLEIKNLSDDSEKRSLLRGHNFWATEKIAEELTDNSNNLDKLYEYLIYKRRKDVKSARQLIVSLELLDKLIFIDKKPVEEFEWAIKEELPWCNSIRKMLNDDDPRFSVITPDMVPMMRAMLEGFKRGGGSTEVVSKIQEMLAEFEPVGNAY